MSVCVYSAKVPTKEQFLEFRQCKEDNMYVCGMTVIPPENNLSEIIFFFEHGINCDKEISPHYYSARQKFPPVCYHCGVMADLVPISEDLRRQYQSIHPLCTECQDDGKKKRTRGRRIAGQKRPRSNYIL